jgi:hypothetical protein
MRVAFDTHMSEVDLEVVLEVVQIVQVPVDH